MRFRDTGYPESWQCQVSKDKVKHAVYSYERYVHRACAVSITTDSLMSG